jgi:hypothetical protein
MIVHNIEMDNISSRSQDSFDLLPQPCEIGGQDRGCYPVIAHKNPGGNAAVLVYMEAAAHGKF